MAFEAVMHQIKQAVLQIKAAIQTYAGLIGWKDEDYSVYAWVNPSWGQIHVLIVVADIDDDVLARQRLELLDHLRLELGNLVEAISLTLHSKARVHHGGLYAIGPEFEKIDDLIVAMGGPAQRLRTAPLQNEGE
jgi:hypothetical protein